jgi:hypothetical protein
LDAARAAAWDAARAAALDAARDAAQGHTTYLAARAAADAVLAPTCARLQASVHDLYLAMINAKLADAAEADRAVVDEVQP